MLKKYSTEIIIVVICLFFCIVTFFTIKNLFFKSKSLTESAELIMNGDCNNNKDTKYKEAVTVECDNKTTEAVKNNVDNKYEEVETKEEDEYPFSTPLYFYEDGSIIYDGMTLTELSDKLNKSLPGYLTNTGYFFADYTKRTGLDPYLAVAIVLLETGCKWNCSSLTKECNNIGGLKGNPSCNGKSYKKYNTLGEGISGYLDIIYNKYYSKGLKTPAQMQSIYAPGSVSWADQVNSYINDVKAK